MAKLSPTERDEAATKYMPLCKSLASRWGSRDPEEIQGSAFVGLAEALNSYEDNKGTQLSTWITYKARGAIIDFLRKQSQIPQGKRKWLADIRQAEEMLEGIYGRPPTLTEVAQKLGVSLSELEQRLYIGIVGRGMQEASIDSDTVTMNTDPEARLALTQTWESLSIPDKVAARMRSYSATYEDIGYVLGEARANVERRIKKVRTRLEGDTE